MYIFSTDHRVNEVRCADHNEQGRVESKISIERR